VAQPHLGVAGCQLSDTDTFNTTRCTFNTTRCHRRVTDTRWPLCTIAATATWPVAGPQGLASQVEYQRLHCAGSLTQLLKPCL